MAMRISLPDRTKEHWLIAPFICDGKPPAELRRQRCSFLSRFRKISAWLLNAPLYWMMVEGIIFVQTLLVKTSTSIECNATAGNQAVLYRLTAVATLVLIAAVVRIVVNRIMNKWEIRSHELE